MIYVTGDIHGGLDISKLNTKNFPQQKHLSKSDFVIICGDFGLVWDGSMEERYWTKWLSEKPFTTLFVDGNHENFDRLRSYPTTEKFGGIVREIAPSIYHLERSQVLTIDGKTFFTMGGAQSHDKPYRIEGRSWWPEEIPSPAEMEQAVKVLEAHDWTVDYVLTHCAPRTVQLMISRYFENDPMVSFLDRIYGDLNFRHWYFGHYHADQDFGEDFSLLYDRIVELEE